MAFWATFHFNNKVCARLKAYGCTKYLLSIDGLRETRDAIRKQGSFIATLHAIPLVRDTGMRCAIVTTVSGTTIHEILQIIDLMVEQKMRQGASKRRRIIYPADIPALDGDKRISPYCSKSKPDWSIFKKQPYLSGKPDGTSVLIKALCKQRGSLASA